MCWADWTAAIPAAIWLLFMGMLAAGGNLVPGAYFNAVVPMAIEVFGAFWIVLRLIDLATGGPARRSRSLVWTRKSGDASWHDGGL